MDRDLFSLLEDFSVKLHELESSGIEIPDDVEVLWASLTQVIEQNRT